jgi:hypothetical protein
MENCKEGMGCCPNAHILENDEWIFGPCPGEKQHIGEMADLFSLVCLGKIGVKP